MFAPPKIKYIFIVAIVALSVFAVISHYQQDPKTGENTKLKPAYEQNQQRRDF